MLCLTCRILVTLNSPSSVSSKVVFATMLTLGFPSSCQDTSAKGYPSDWQIKIRTSSSGYFIFWMFILLYEAAEEEVEHNDLEVFVLFWGQFHFLFLGTNLYYYLYNETPVVSWML